VEPILISRRGNPEVKMFLNKAIYSPWGEERRVAIKRLAELGAISALFIVAQRSKWADERKLAEEKYIGLRKVKE